MTENKSKKQTYLRWTVLVMRLAVGSVFAFSGFVKAIDPWGVLYKFEDYVAALGCDWLSPFLLFGAFAVSIFEFVLGVCLIVGAYRRFSTWSALLMMLVMTPLTLWLAVTGAVPDCGCFGEALVMSNAATFLKNAVLLAAVIFLMRYNVRVGNIYSPSIQWIVTLCTVVFITTIAFYGYFYQPMLDFRPYVEGSAIVAQPGDEGQAEEDAFVFVYEKDGELTEFSVDEIPDDSDTAWTFVERKEIAPAQKDSNATGLVLTKEGEDVTAEVMKQDGEQLVLVFSDMENIDITYTYLINVIDDFARRIGVDLVGVTGASLEDVEEWNDMSMATYPIYSADDTELKVIARGNPAVVYVKDGKIVWKRTLQSISAARVNEAINGKGDFTWIAADYDGANRLQMMSLAYLSTMVLILILNRSYRVYKFSARLIKKNRK